MGEPLHKMIPQGLTTDRVNSSDRAYFALLWMKEVRSRNVLVPKMLLYVMSASAIGWAILRAQNSADALGIGGVGLIILFYLVFLENRIHPELSSSEMNATAAHLLDKGYKELVDEIRYARD